MQSLTPHMTLNGSLHVRPGLTVHQQFGNFCVSLIEVAVPAIVHDNVVSARSSYTSRSAHRSLLSSAQVASQIGRTTTGTCL